jgi:hypothetical protein
LAASLASGEFGGGRQHGPLLLAVSQALDLGLEIFHVPSEIPAL